MTAAPAEPAARAAERVARLSYGRVLATLARAWRDVPAAEDALGDAFRRALETWPRTGVPENPEAWLLVVARNRLGDEARARGVRAHARPTLETLADDLAAAEPAAADPRLALMFVCAHPAIDAAARTPLMLQTILGFDAARIASAFLISPAAMAQRLVRAKARIREAGLRFAAPEPEDLPARGAAVREAIYAAYGAGWDEAFAGPASGLADEAVWLARVLVDLQPDEPEARGLLAFMLFCEARGAARRSADGAYVPLSAQDPKRWRPALLVEAEMLLRAASRSGRTGRFQLEAAIQSAHVQAVITGRDLGAALLALHDALVVAAPTVGSRLGRAAALSEVRGAEAGLAAIAALPEAMVRDHQPYWALRGRLLLRLGYGIEASTALTRAAGLTADPAVRAFLLAARPPGLEDAADF